MREKESSGRLNYYIYIRVCVCVSVAHTNVFLFIICVLFGRFISISRVSGGRCDFLPLCFCCIFVIYRQRESKIARRGLGLFKYRSSCADYTPGDFFPAIFVATDIVGFTLGFDFLREAFHRAPCCFLYIIYLADTSNVKKLEIR